MAFCRQVAAAEGVRAKERKERCERTHGRNAGAEPAEEDIAVLVLLEVVLCQRQLIVLGKELWALGELPLQQLEDASLLLVAVHVLVERDQLVDHQLDKV